MSKPNEVDEAAIDIGVCEGKHIHMKVFLSVASGRVGREIELVLDKDNALEIAGDLYAAVRALNPDPV